MTRHAPLPRHSETTAPSTLAPASPVPASRRELLAASIVIAAVLAAPLLVPALRIMYLKSLWLDELHTWLLSRELSAPLLIARLRAGADFNPPLLHLIDAVALRLLPAAPPQLVLRLTSVTSVWIALVLLYRICRERLRVLPSAIGVMAVLAHSTMMVQIHEARFYAPWMALAVIVAWSMQRVVDEPTSVWRFVQLTLATAAICLIHYFGVIAVACLALGLAVGVRPLRRLVRPAVAVAAGMLALAAWLPVYAAQRTVLSVATWIDAPTLETAAAFVALYLMWYAFAPVVAAAVAWSFADRRRPRPALPRPTPAQWALLGLVALPLVIVAFSYVVQPALVARYALPALAGMALIVAIAASRLPHLAQSLVLVAMVASHAVLLRRQARHDRAFQRVVDLGVAELGAVAGDARPVVSMERSTLYPAALSAANRNGNVAYLVLPTNVVRKHAGPDELHSFNFVIVERDGTIAHNKIFGFPPLISLDRMRRLTSFYLLEPDSSVTPGWWLGRFNGFRACRAGPTLLRFDASPGTHAMERALDQSPRCDGSPAPLAGTSPALESD